MENSDIKFDAKFRMPLKISQQKEPVVLVLSDSLKASRQELQTSYKTRIVRFVNSDELWYPLCVDRIRSENKRPGKTELMRLYVLSEQSDEPLVFGLSFRVKFDIEHGRGMKIEAGTLNIIEYGDADVAFS